MKGMPYCSFIILARWTIEPEHCTTLSAGAVAAADVVDPAVAGDGGHDLDAHPLVVAADHPGFAGQVEIAQDVDAGRGDAARCEPGADELGQRAWQAAR